MKIYKLIGTTLFVLLLTGIGANIALAGLDESKAEEKTKTDINISAGYRGVSEDNNPSRALEYDSLKSSPLFNVDLATDQGSYFLKFNFDYLNENDYSGELNLNGKGLAQVNLRSERFFHNLDHIPYDNGVTGGEPTTAVPDPGPPLVRVPSGSPVEGSRPDGAFTNSLGNDVTRTFYSDQNPSDDYGLRLDTNEFKVRVKHPTYPAHLNLAYWRYEKKGDKQLRFVGENCATACHMQSKTRKIDRVTEEFKAEVDAHVGIVDLALETLFRTFHDRESIPRDNFGSHRRGRDISGNPLQHSEDPDSQITELTLKANTAPSGGLVGSASFTIGKRENESDLNSISPVKAETDYYKTAANATYTPSENWTFNLRYRLLDLDSDNTNQFSAGSYGNTNNNPLEVRDPVDITRSSYEAIVNYRPSRHLTLKGELRREDIDRSNTGHDGKHESSDDPDVPIEINPNWELPDEETITLAKLGFSARLLERSALKFSGWVSIQHSDEPAYGSSFEDSQQLFLSSSYNPSPFWGFLANARFLKQENDSHEMHDYEFERDKDQQNINLGTYVTPGNGLSFDLNYGYFHTEIDQGILVGTGSSFVPKAPFFRPVNYAIADDSGDYEQTINTLTLGMTWQMLEDLSCRLEGHYSESEASFSPDFNVEGPYPYNAYGPGPLYSGTQTSSDLKEISELDIQQIGLRGRLNWKIDEEWSCSMEATYDDYDDKNSNYYDGSVQTAMVSFSRGW